jgi:hypothetical protein
MQMAWFQLRAIKLSAKSLAICTLEIFFQTNIMIDEKEDSRICVGTKRESFWLIFD